MNDIIATIGLDTLTVNFSIGVTEKERSRPQPVEITIQLRANISEAIRTDAIDQTVDYSGIRKAVIHLSHTYEYHLIERLAGEIAALCFDDPKVQACRVTVRKMRIYRDCTPFIETVWINRGVYANMPAEAAQ